MLLNDVAPSEVILTLLKQLSGGGSVLLVILVIAMLAFLSFFPN